MHIKDVVTKLNCLLHKIIYFRLFKKVKLFGVPHIIMPSKVKIGHLTRINPNVFIQGAGGVSIGNNVTLSYGTSIFSTGYDVSNWQKNKYEKLHFDAEVSIEDNVWICANVTIQPGVTISQGVIVAPGAVVTCNLTKKNALYGGVPAKFIKRLY